MKPATEPLFFDYVLQVQKTLMDRGVLRGSLLRRAALNADSGQVHKVILILLGLNVETDSIVALHQRKRLNSAADNARFRSNLIGLTVVSQVHRAYASSVCRIN